MLQAQIELKKKKKSTKRKDKRNQNHKLYKHTIWIFITQLRGFKYPISIFILQTYHHPQHSPFPLHKGVYVRCEKVKDRGDRFNYVPETPTS